MVKLAAAILCAGCFLLTVAGDKDFDLADALDTVTTRPAPATKKPPAGNNPRPNLYPDLRPQPGSHGNDGNNPRPNLYPDLRPQPGSHGNDGNNPRPNLYPDLRPHPGSHGNDGNKPTPKPYPDIKPQAGGHGNDVYINDLDLNDGNPPQPAGDSEHFSDHGGNLVDSSTTAQITSPVVAVVLLLTVGTIASYSAYKKKRYCFKPRANTVV
ncbi:glycoprotein Xg-like isoform X1 [Elgaria multicarinata webbii]|uniref:glycoprotein Xg-like isoform X1 n=1 Tax=Elgaria multicarinata webbii TaxID=159646 RepID=UPI002FCCC028